MDDLRAILSEMEEKLRETALKLGYIKPNQRVVLTFEIYTPEDESEIQTKVGALDPKVANMSLPQFFSEERIAEAGFLINPNRVLISRIWRNELVGQKGRKLETLPELIKLGRRGVKKNIRDVGDNILNMVAVILKRIGINFD